MQIGIMAKTFARPSLGATLDAVVAHGLFSVQFNLTCAGLPTLPDTLDAATAVAIHDQLAARGIAMAAVSGTFNLIHPDPVQRNADLRRLGVLAAACRFLGTGIVTLCTGTRDPDDMWRRHPGNDAPEAWRDLLASLEVALGHAERDEVTLGIEPEVSNVVDSARKARRLLAALRSPRLKIIMDPANLFHAGELPSMQRILAEAFDLLGGDVILAHAKDLSRDGEAGHEAAGAGLLDYDAYVRLLRRAGYEGPLILHSLREDQVDASIAFLRTMLDARPETL